MTRRASLTGISTRTPGRNAGTKYNPRAANQYLFPPDPHGLSTRALLKRGYVAQALIDSATVCFGLLFLCALAGSIPLALFLMIFASF